MGDTRVVVSGARDNEQTRFELGQGGRRIRCSKGHSTGSGVRPDVLQVDRDLKYIIHGESLAPAHCTARDGIRKGDLPHAQFYECDDNGNVHGGHTVRGGSEGVIAVSARQSNDDGVSFYRARSDSILTEGANGAFWPKYPYYIF